MKDLHLQDFATEIWSNSVAKHVDSLSISKFKIPSKKLMDQAGHWVAVATAISCKPGQKIMVLAGPGNNGGDGLVAAQILHQWGFEVHVLDCAFDKSKTTLDRQNAFKGLDGQIHIHKTPGKFFKLSQGAVIIDALLGLGLKGKLRPGKVRDTLEAAAAANASLVIAVDLPSGLDGDLFAQEPPPLPAHQTISFGAPKLAHKVLPSATYCGKTKIYDIGFSASAIKESLDQEATLLWQLDSKMMSQLNPWHGLAPDSHKFDRGHVLVIGGSKGKTGAPIMTGIAAARAGAGWVTLACEDPQNLPSFLTWEPLYKNGVIDPDALEQFIQERRVRSVVIGPGMMSSPFNDKLMLVLQKLSKSGVSFIIDAGALDQIAPRLKAFPLDASRCLVTPHYGEFLKGGFGKGPIENLKDCSDLEAKCQQYGISLFYKSASPFAVGPNIKGNVLLSPYTNKKLAKAGTGDVLAGICAALLLCEVPAWAVGPLSHWIIHAESQRLERQLGASILPIDIAENLNLEALFKT